MTRVEIIEPVSEEDFERYYELRWRLLRAPWNRPRGSERDARDADAFHVMACADDRAAIGVGRAHFNTPNEAQVRFMAVEPAWQGRGVGTMILARLEDEARRRGAGSCVLDARQTAVDFYRDRGYTIEGEGHTLYGVIRHQRMRKKIR